MTGWFVTATDTNVGKTFVASRLIRLLNEQGVLTAGYKPVASGAIFDSTGHLVWEDVETLAAACEGRWPKDRICPQCFKPPLAPPFAASADSLIVDELLIQQGADWWRDKVDHLIVEGAGGWLSPLSDRWSNADFALQLDFPILLVARLGLGTINHTLLTLESIERRGGQILGMVLTEASPNPDDLSTSQNPVELQRRTKHPILAVIPHQTEMNLTIPDPLRTVPWKLHLGK